MKDATDHKWATAELASVSKVFTDGNWIETKDQASEGIRLVQTGNVGEGVFKDRRDKARWIDDQTFDRLKCFEVLPGDCLVSRLPDPVGRACIIPETGDKMITAVDCTVIRPDEARVDPQFFVYYSQSSEYLRNVDDRCTGTTRRRISRKNLGKIPIPLPQLEEQQRIVAVLDEAFESLARARTHAAANLQNAQELFENILTHTLRHKFEQGAQKLLGDICDLAQGLAINKGTKHLLVENSSKPLLRIKDLRNNTVEQYVAETGYPPKAAVTADDIIYTRTGQIGLVFRGFEGVLHNNCFSVRTLGDVSQEYLFWWLQEPVFKSEIISLASRAAQPDITHKLFKARSITFPNKDDQASAVELIEDAFSETESLQGIYQNKIQDIDDLRQSILQKAFAGELT